MKSKKRPSVPQDISHQCNLSKLRIVSCLTTDHIQYTEASFVSSTYPEHREDRHRYKRR